MRLLNKCVSFVNAKFRAKPHRSEERGVFCSVSILEVIIGWVKLFGKILGINEQKVTPLNPKLQRSAEIMD